jgi:hypothetical protein
VNGFPRTFFRSRNENLLSAYRCDLLRRRIGRNGLRSALRCVFRERPLSGLALPAGAARVSDVIFQVLNGTWSGVCQIVQPA